MAFRRRVGRFGCSGPRATGDDEWAQVMRDWQDARIRKGTPPEASAASFGRRGPLRQLRSP
ncbi:hypothetical protein [Streptomyces sp. NPDC055134]